MPAKTTTSSTKKTTKKVAAQIDRNTIAGGDCIKTMRAWPEDSADLIFADPPYNIGFSYDQYKDTLDDDKYIAWTCDWIDAATRLLKPSGSMYILIGDEYAAETRVHLKKLQKEGKLLFRNWIVWHYTFGQRCKIKFNRSHAHLFYCVGSAAVNKKGQPKSNITASPPFTFNYDAVAVPSARMTTYKDARSNPKGKLPDDTWYQRFPNSKDWYQRPQDAKVESQKRSDQDPDAPEGRYFDPDCDTWYLSRLCGTFKEREQWHPCQLPEALLERIILTSSNAGDLVFDPFAGSGTTLAVANRLKRDWLGTELSPDYRKKALKRIKAAGQPEKKPRKVVTKNGKKPGRG